MHAAPVTPALEALVAAVGATLADPALATDRARTEALRPAMSALLVAEDPVPPEAEEPFEGSAVGNLLHVDPDGRYHVLAVVFPEGTSSGVHHHGCWGVIGYLQLRYRPATWRWYLYGVEVALVVALAAALPVVIGRDARVH